MMHGSMVSAGKVGWNNPRQTGISMIHYKSSSDEIHWLNKQEGFVKDYVPAGNEVWKSYF